MDPTIPRGLDEISAAWLTTALRSAGLIAGPTEVTSVETKILGTGEGFAGDLARLTVAYAGGSGPPTMVAKVPTSIDDNRSGAELLGVYEREIRMYQTVLGDLDAPTPRLYYADVVPNPDWEKQLASIRRAERLPLWILRIVVWLLDRFAKPEPRPSVLILEDLAPAVVGDQVAGAELERIGAVLDVAARLHADTWGPRLPAPGPWLQSGGIAPKLFQASFLSTRKKFLTGAGRAISAHMRALLDRLGRDGIARGRRMHESVPQCLLHGDLRLDNMFFDPGTGAVRALIDWQLARTGPAVVDVAYFIAGSVDPAVPEPEVTELLHRYHRGLVAAGVDDYPLERFLADYDDALLMVLGSLTAVEGLDMGDARGRDLVRAMVDRLDARLGRVAA
ncbi:MAG: phosphotransferase [Acidimicrobiales bacterium]